MRHQEMIQSKLHMVQSKLHTTYLILSDLLSHKIGCVLLQSMQKWKLYILYYMQENTLDMVDYMNKRLGIQKTLFHLHWFIPLNSHLLFHTRFHFTTSLTKKTLGTGFHMSLQIFCTIWKNTTLSFTQLFEIALKDGERKPSKWE